MLKKSLSSSTIYPPLTVTNLESLEPFTGDVTYFPHIVIFFALTQENEPHNIRTSENLETLFEKLNASAPRNIYPNVLCGCIYNILISRIANLLFVMKTDLKTTTKTCGAQKCFSVLARKNAHAHSQTHAVPRHAYFEESRRLKGYRASFSPAFVPSQISSVPSPDCQTGSIARAVAP